MVEVTTTTYKLVGTGDNRELVVAPAVYKIEAGGNPSGATTAELVSIEDAGNYYTSENVEGALQEVGASLGGIIEPQSGEGIEVENDGSVNLGSSANANNTSGPRYLRGDFELYLISMDGTRLITMSPELAVMGFDGIEVSSNRSFSARNYTTERQTLSISVGLIAWNIANGQSAVVTLTQSATLSNPTNLPASTFTIYPDLEVIQNGTGGWVLSFGSNFVLPSTFVAAPTTANSRTLYHFHQRSDGKLAVNYTHYTT